MERDTETERERYRGERKTVCVRVSSGEWIEESSVLSSQPAAVCPLTGNLLGQAFKIKPESATSPQMRSRSP